MPSLKRDANTQRADVPADGKASPFAYPIFRAIWGANLFSSLGGLIQSVGASWMMLTLSGSATMVALVQSSTTLPIFLLALFAGALADSFDRRRVMLFAQIGMMLVSIALTAAAFLGWLTPWSLLAFTFLIGCGTALNAPTWQAAVGDMVPRPVLPSAVTYNSVGFNIARSLGPAVGGMLVAAVGAVASFAVNAISYTGVIAVLSRWSYRRPADTLPREPISEAMGSGIRYVLMSPAQIAVLGRGLIYGLGSVTMGALMPLVAHDFLHGTAGTYGILLAFFGIGSILGALPINRLRNRVGSENLVRIFIGVTAIGLVVVGLSRHMALTIVGVLFGGMGWIAVLATLNVTIQLSSPRWVVARAVAIYQMFTFGGMAFGGWLAGYLAEITSIQTAFLMAAGIECLAILIGFAMPLSDAMELDLAPLMPRDAPRTALPLDPRAGPVYISICYRIAPEYSRRFVALMHERRRIRRRDGAHGWSLQRDLSDPEIWHERFQHPTWISYVRHNTRRTRADLGNWKAIQSLHLGPEPPQVERTIQQQTTQRPHAWQPAEGQFPHDPSGIT